MQQRTSFNRSLATAGLFGLIASLLLASLSISSPSVNAQDADPTATPQTPIWLGFAAARDAIEEEESVDLSIVQRWEFFQDNFEGRVQEHPENIAGIDSCSSTTSISEAREVYYGWTYVITDLDGNDYEARVSFDLDDVVLCDIRTTTTVTNPDPESTAEANEDLPESIDGSADVEGFELGGHILNFSEEAGVAMSASGMTWIKKQLPTAAGVQEGVNYINTAQGAGYKILLGVIGDKEALAADPEGYAQEFATFVGALAEAGADAIEVWNEPNIDREWPADQISGSNYTALLAVASNAIRQNNPNTLIISGAPAPTGFFGTAGCGAGGCNDDVFMQQMANAGAAQYIDCVGLHYNEGVVSPGTFSGDPRGEYPTRYFESMTNRGTAAFPGKPVCYTELGYLSPEGFGPLPQGFTWASDVSVAEHAAWLAEAATRAAQRGDVRLMIVWNVNFKRFDTDPMGGYAMIRPDGNCPACETLGAVMGR